MDYDAVVIGGGPAGCAVATRMAEGGLGVAVVESRAFPRVKVCGEFVSPAATGVLESLISARELAALGAGRVDRFEIVTGRGVHRWRMPREAWALGRGSLDAALLARAEAAGAAVLQPEAVRSVEYGAEGVCVLLSRGARLRARVVVHADGSGRHDPAGPTLNVRGFLGRKCHLRLPERVGCVRMIACDGGYAGLIDVEGGLSTVALVAGAGLVRRHGGDADALLCAMWPGYDPAWRESDWCSTGVARGGYRGGGDVRSFRIGNAAAAVDPVGGEGIGLALWSGDLLGRMLSAAGVGDGAALVRVRRRMARAYRRRLWFRRPACRVGAEVLSRPRLTAIARPLLAAPTLSVGVWYRASGKPGARRLQES